MSKTQIAAQLYTVREFIKTPDDIARSMEKIREIGYEAVQISGMGPIPPAECRKLMDDNGLIVAATHIGFEAMQNETERVIEEHHILGCKYPAIGGLPGAYRDRGAEGYAEFAKLASEVGKKLAEAGLTFGYHNHSFELEKFGDRTGLAILYEDSDPQYFTGELDTYWVQHGGGDPAAWIRKLQGRSFLVHFKDMRNKGSQQQFAEIGEGNLNWPNILEACKSSGVEWYIVEQDLCYDRDPFDSLKISLDNMKAWGLR
jgi:sugar phosphate isomerase/epimerase